jgi:hypothetical protein
LSLTHQSAASLKCIIFNVEAGAPGNISNDCDEGQTFKDNTSWRPLKHHFQEIYREDMEYNALYIIRR